MDESPKLLGIDIGTSKVAAVIIDTGKNLLAVSSRIHHADIQSGPGLAEQDAEKLLQTVNSVVNSLPEHLREKVEAVGVTGQMHGLVLSDSRLHPLSPLITWQDARCMQNNFLTQLSQRTGQRLHSGYGCATLAWLIAHGELPAGSKNACTIQDLFVARLCGLSRPVTDPTDAASWGLFDLHSRNWIAEAIERADIPGEILPQVLPSQARAGALSPPLAETLGIPPGIPVAVAIGDNQASLLAVLAEPEHDLALNLGTGGQLSAVLPATASAQIVTDDSPFEYRPYPDEKLVAVASSLCGGSAWAWLADTVDRWLSDLNLPALPRDRLFQRLNELGWNSKSELKVFPHFLGERYDESLKASISGIRLDNFDLGTLACSLAHGIVANLKSMLPAFAFANRKQVVGSGNALRRNPLLRQAAERVLELPLQMSDLQEEAACGAALHAAALLRF